ncbi:Exopolysaccharide biosynthesis protein EpsF [Vibrio aestuarianus]|nr:Exopolysaccharide biosynthesis protein EpsF [Vibrio aestuarianus]
MMRKILLVVPLSTVKWGNDNAGGVDSVCQQIIRFLAENPPDGYIYEILAIKVGVSDVELFKKQKLHERVTLTFIPNKGKVNGVKLPGFLFQNYHLNKICKRFKPDIVHSHLLSLPLYLQAGIRSIVTLHSYGKIGRTPRGKMNDILFEHILPRRTLHLANKITCVGDILCDAIREIYPNKIIKIGNPIDDAFFKSCNDRRRNNLTFRLVTCSIITPKKQIDKMIELMSELSKHIDIELIVIGPGGSAYLAELKRKASDLMIDNKIHWLGSMSQPEIFEQYKKSDAAIFLSKEETFGLAPLEMLATGLPLISTRVGILDEQYAFFKESGVLFVDLENTTNSVKDCLDFLNKPHEIDRELLANRFSANSIVQQYQNVYRELER